MMRIRIPQQFPDPMKLFKWHVYFTLLPRRLDAETVAWMENIARRKTTSQAYHRIGPVRIDRPFYLYGPLTNVLTQPGVTVDVSAAQQVQPGPAPNKPYGYGVSQPQAGSIALSGGSIGNLGQGCQGVHAQGAANAGPPAPGGYNPSPPQP